MDPILLQQQLKNNNQDFLDFRKDLISWGKEMEKKDQERKPQKSQVQKKDPISQETKKQKVEDDNKIKKEMLDDKREVKKTCMTYADWDKFDADKECEKLDKDSDNESDSLLEDLKDQAIIEKEQGNKFVKVGKWEDAVRSYTNAIKYYAYDPIFYANRALCYLKTQQMEKAEKDCTVALKLDNTYVKAYQRRAAARESLCRWDEARLDLLRVLELEPKNSESKKKLDELTEKIKSSKPQKPVSKFSQSRQHSKRQSEITNYAISQETSEKTTSNIDSNKPECFWPSGDVNNIVKAVQKPPHMRSTKPLKRIIIEEINSAIPESCQNKGSNQLNQNSKFIASIKTEDIKIIQHKHPETNPSRNSEIETIKKQEVIENEKGPELRPPKTSVQFHAIWKQLKGQNDKKSEYLRLVNPKNIPALFKDSLESQVFSEILLVLAEHFTREEDQTYDYLLNLSEIKRFSALSMFLTLNDKNSLWKMFNHMKEHEGRSKEEIDSLISKYELL